MTTWKNYYLAKDIEDALQALSGQVQPARIVAGGTDLLLDLQQGRTDSVGTLVDVTAVPEMGTLEKRTLEVGDELLFVGAAVPLSKVAGSPQVMKHAQALVEACRLIGGPQVRNSATLGGNVAHALPAADGSIALLALDAQAEVACVAADGGCDRRIVPLSSLFLGPGKSALRQGCELLVGFYLPLHESGQASAFRRIMRPQGVALPVLNAACWLERREEKILDLRVAVGPAGGTPFRARDVEKVLRGSGLNDASLRSAKKALLSSVHFRTSPRRASAEYRQHLAGGLVEEVLEAAWERAA